MKFLATGFQAATPCLISCSLPPWIFHSVQSCAPRSHFHLPPHFGPCFGSCWADRKWVQSVLSGPIQVPFPKLHRVSAWQVTFCWHWTRDPEMARDRAGTTWLRIEYFQCTFDSHFHSGLLIRPQMQRGPVLHFELAGPKALLVVIRTSRTPGRGKSWKDWVFWSNFLKKRKEWKTHKTQKHSLPLAHSHGNASLMILDSEVKALGAGVTVTSSSSAPAPCASGTPLLSHQCQMERF